jgi:DNA-binding transcriptional LysR family regulator
MKIDQLTYFLETARRESVGKAAKNLGLSPSAISTSISMLERELGCPLFVRERQRIHLTSAGRVLMDRATSIVRELDSLKSDIQSPTRLFEGSYKLACARVLAVDVVGETWAKFHAIHPKLSVELSTLRSIEVVAKAATGEIDLGICLDPRAHPDVSTRVIGKDRYRVAVRKAHPLTKRLAKRRATTTAATAATAAPATAAAAAATATATAAASAAALAKLTEYPACMPRAFDAIGAGYEAHPLLAALDIHPRVDLVYDSYDVVLHRLRHSDAWALLPTTLLRGHHRDELAFIDIGSHREADLTIAAVWPRRSELNPVLALFVKNLTESLRTR